MLKQTIVAAVAAVGLAVPAAALDTLRVGMSGEDSPFAFARQDELQGFEIDVMNAVGEEAGLDIQIETMSISDLLDALEAGQIDTIASQITVTPGLEQAFVFSQPYVIIGAQVVTREGNDDIGGVEDLRGKSVAVSPDTISEKLLRDLPYAEEIDIHAYEMAIEYDTALGRMDALVMHSVLAAQVVERSPLPLKLAGQPFATVGIALPFRETGDGRELRNRVDEALTALKEDGTLAEISQTWFDADITGPVSQ